MAWRETTCGSTCSVGDALDVSAPRGSFTLQPGERPVVLLSAGIGATPVLAMLHALAEARSTRQVLWLHAARDRGIIHSRPRCVVCCSRSRTAAAMFVTAGRGGRQGGRGFRRYRPPVTIGIRGSRCTAGGRCVSVRADGFMTEMKEALPALAWRRSGFTWKSSTAASR